MAFPLLKKPHTINMTDCLMISGPFLLSDRHFYQQYGGFLKWGYPQNHPFSSDFPSILGYLHLWKPMAVPPSWCAHGPALSPCNGPSDTLGAKLRQRPPHWNSALRGPPRLRWSPTWRLCSALRLWTSNGNHCIGVNGWYWWFAVLWNVRFAGTW